MIPSKFSDSNAVFNPPSKADANGDVVSIDAYVGRLPGDHDGTSVRVVTRWRPIREEVEGLMQGASIWLHIMGEQMPPVAIGCFDPFKPVVQTGAVHGTPIDPADPMQAVEALAAMDALRMLFKSEGVGAEELTERIARYVHSAELLRKQAGG